MMRLDQNRAMAQLAGKAGKPVTAVTNAAIWGNHSATQFPDYFHAKIEGKPATDVITDKAWLEGAFISTVQKRGAAIIEARGLSSAASAANAAIDHVKSVRAATAKGDWFSAGVRSDGNPYGIPKGLVCSFPLRSDGSKWEIVSGLTHTAFAKERIDLSIKELQEERDAVKEMIPG